MVASNLRELQARPEDIEPARAYSLIAAYIQAARPSDQARAAAREGVLDFLAVSLPIAWRLAPDAGLESIFALFGKDDPAGAALRMGYQAHALDFDDIHSGMRGHPSTVVLPALLALIGFHAKNTSVELFLDAYVIGVELCGRIAQSMGPHHYPNGFHSTATIGTVAAAGAAARLLNLDIDGIDNALGLAATCSAGLRAQFGSAAKPLHAGMAARTAVESALLAQSGFQGNVNVLAAFIQTLGGEGADLLYLEAQWADAWRIVTPGLTFKRYPTCGGTHGAADAALALRAKLIDDLGGDARYLVESIDSIEVSFPPGADMAPFIRTPRTGVEARFSLEYVIAVALVQGRLPIELFAEVPVAPAIAELAKRVKRSEDHNVPHDSLNPAGRFHEVSITLTDGRTLRIRITKDDVAAVSVDVLAKLHDALRRVPEAQVESVVDYARLLATGDIHSLIVALLSPEPAWARSATAD